METVQCSTCQKAKAPLVWGVCSGTLCKNCAQFLDEDAFSFLAKVPPEVSHTTYCQTCYDTHVVPQLVSYNSMMDQAREILIYYKDEGKDTRMYSRIEDKLVVLNCADRKEAILRLAFMAVQGGFNAVIDIDVYSKKIRTGAYQTLQWQATGIPTQITAPRMWRR